MNNPEIFFLYFENEREINFDYIMKIAREYPDYKLFQILNGSSVTQLAFGPSKKAVQEKINQIDKQFEDSENEDLDVKQPEHMTGEVIVWKKRRNYE